MVLAGSSYDAPEGACRFKFPLPTEAVDGATLWPADLYVGSGVSYEAGLPTLCDMHEVFCVDNETQDSFTVGVSDALPRLLAEEGQDRLVKFCEIPRESLVRGAHRRCGRLRS